VFVLGAFELTERSDFHTADIVARPFTHRPRFTGYSRGVQRSADPQMLPPQTVALLSRRIPWLLRRPGGQVTIPPCGATSAGAGVIDGVDFKRTTLGDVSTLSLETD